MSVTESTSLASPPAGREPPGQRGRPPLLHQQLQRYKDPSGNGENTHDTSDQQQQQRPRRPRSIHITLRKTRSGSRPVNIHRHQHYVSSNAADRVSSAHTTNNGNGNGNPLGSSSSGGGAVQAMLSNGLPAPPPYNALAKRLSAPTLASPNSNTSASAATTATAAAATIAPEEHLATLNHRHYMPRSRSLLERTTNIMSGHTSNQTPFTTPGQSGSMKSDTAFPSSAGGSAVVGPSSSSSSVGLGGNGGNGGSAQVLNTFVNVAPATLQQLLPPSMRDRVKASRPLPDAATNSQQQKDSSNNNNNSSSTAETSPREAGRTPRLRQHSHGPSSQRTRSRSQVYLNGAGMPPLPVDGHGNMPASGGLRSSSVNPHGDGLSASHSGGLGDFVFPHPDHSNGAFSQQPIQQPYVPLAAAWRHSAAIANSTATTVGQPPNMPTISTDSRSPRLPTSSNAGGAATATQERNHAAVSGGEQPGQVPPPQQQQHTHTHIRSRSYNAGGRHPHAHFHSLGNNTTLAAATATAAGAGGAAMFSPQASHSESGYVSRNLDRSLSISSNPAGQHNSNSNGGASSLMTKCNHTNHTTGGSRGSLRNGVSTRETTPVGAASGGTTTTATTASLPGVPRQPTPSTPPAQQQQRAQRHTLTPTAVSPCYTSPTTAISTAVPPAGVAAAAGGANATDPPLLYRPDYRSDRGRSNSFTAARSISSDVVNGLDDSADGVLCGSLPAPGNGGRNVSGGWDGTTLCRYSGVSGAGSGTNRYLTDSVTSDHVNGINPNSSGLFANASDGTPRDQQQRSRRHSTVSTDEEDARDGLTTLDRLRSRRDGGGAGGVSRPALKSHFLSTRRDDQTDNSNTSSPSAEPKTAIGRWRAQEKKREERESAVVVPRGSGGNNNDDGNSAAPYTRHRLSARQWREAFQRLEENRVKWSMRAFIGAGTSGKVYEGVLEDKEHTPVAVKVLDVGVPMPVGPSASSRDEDTYMSPSQQEALLVLLREVEMMEKLHHGNIVTCIRCQVTPVQDRYMELRQHVEQPPRASSPSNHPNHRQRRQQPFSEEEKAVDKTSMISNVSGQRPGSSTMTRIPVQVEIIMELCKRGTLASVVRRSPGGQLPMVTARRYLRDVLRGLTYLHRNNFIHRDVKGDNVLISAADVAKLADFGCSRRIVMTNSPHHTMHVDQFDATMRSPSTTHTNADSRYTTANNTTMEYQWCDATGVAQTMVGTPMFMAPEIIQASGAPAPPPATLSASNLNNSTSSAAASPPVGYTSSADIWAFGCLILEVFGRSPWPTAGNSAYHLMKQIEQSVGDLPPGVPPDTPAELLQVLRCCFCRDPFRRSTARMLLRSPWMTCKDEELEEMPSRRRH